MSLAESLDVIVRLHTLERSFELKRCLISIVGQDYEHIIIRLFLQRFTTRKADEIGQMAGELCAINPTVQLQVYNFKKNWPQDARTELLNLGLSRANGRYLAFLDYDDVVYPHMYSSLIARLKITQASIAFCGVVAALADVSHDALLIRRKEARFVGSGLRGLLIDNHCPIHGLVIDRHTIDPADLYFRKDLTRLEDYEFLLRLCAKYRSDFHLKNQPMADYYLKSDQSNTVVLAPRSQIDEQKRWAKAREKIAQLRAHLELSRLVASDLGQAVLRRMTVEEYLENLPPQDRVSLTQTEQMLLERWYPKGSICSTA